MFDPKIWAQVPFGFWTFSFFVLGCIVGSFLNVCIYRIPRNESLVHPPSHCPHCGYSIPWYLNIPLVTWVWLRARCASCGKEISARYFLVELLTGLVFAGCWVGVGHRSAPAAIVYCILISGLIVATFIDIEHYIIPDEITLGGMVVGLIAAFFAPASHLRFPGMLPMQRPSSAMGDSVIGIIAGAGIVYAILRGGKLLFGRYRVKFPAGSRILFTETALKLPDQELPFEELFYRDSDAVKFTAERVETVDRCYQKVDVQVQPKLVRIGQDTFDPEHVLHLEAVASQIVLPREAMGFGDVTFMGAIGSFLGWRAVVFSLAASSVIGSAVGITLVLTGRRAWSNRLPYGPYIAVAAVIWIFWGCYWWNRWF